MNNTANENFPHKYIYSSSSSSSTTTLDFFARDDVALGFLAVVACFVDAGRYDASDHEKGYLQCTNLSLLGGRLVHIVIPFIMFHLGQFLRKILARSFGLVLTVENQIQYNNYFRELMVSDLGSFSLRGASLNNSLPSSGRFWFLCTFLSLTFLER